VAGALPSRTLALLSVVEKRLAAAAGQPPVEMEGATSAFVLVAQNTANCVGGGINLELQLAPAHLQGIQISSFLPVLQRFEDI
jgi:hypothetical protein